MIKAERFTEYCIALFLFLGIISISKLTFAQASISAPTTDISQEELIELEMLIEGVNARLKKGENDSNEGAVVIIRVIDRLEVLRQKHPSSSKIDVILFLSGEAKTLIGNLADFSSPSSQSPPRTYVDKHRDWYEFPYLAIVYNGEDYKKLIKDYPNSPLADDAAYALAINQTMGGECESDMDCHIQRALIPLLPFIKKYPASPKAFTVMNVINDTLELMHHPENGHYEIYDIKKTGPLLNEYYDALMALPDNFKRSFNYDWALYKLARTFVSIGQYKKAKKIYEELQGYHPSTMEKAVHLVFYFNDNPKNAGVTNVEVEQYLDQLKTSAEDERLDALDKISQGSISDKFMLLKVLFDVADSSIKDESPGVRKRAIETIKRLLLAHLSSLQQWVTAFCMTRIYRIATIA